jgi:hypothetical protein
VPAKDSNYNRIPEEVAPVEDHRMKDLYYWGGIDEEWINNEGKGEYTREKYLCTDFRLAFRLIENDYAKLLFSDEEKDEVMLLMVHKY